MSRKVEPQAPIPPPERRYHQEELRRPAVGAVNAALGGVVVLGSRRYRYWRNLGAILVSAVALLTLFGLTGLSSGTVLNAWAEFLRRWLGWGAILVPVSLGWLAWLQLAPHALLGGASVRIHWPRIIAG